MVLPCFKEENANSSQNMRPVIVVLADVPCGVYFLHVFAAGVDEIPKVVIVH